MQSSNKIPVIYLGEWGDEEEKFELYNLDIKELPATFCVPIGSDENQVQEYAKKKLKEFGRL